MGFILLAVTFFALLISGCSPDITTQSRGYVITIENQSSLTVDSIVITKSVGMDTTTTTLVPDEFTLSYISNDSTSDSTQQIIVDFTIDANQSQEIYVSYSCYNNDIVIINKTSHFSITDKSVTKIGGVRPLVITTLENYDSLRTQEATQDSLLFDSLFIAGIINGDSSEPRTLFDAYLERPTSDSATLLNSLLDTLDGRNTLYANTVLIQMLNIDLDAIVNLIAERNSNESSSSENLTTDPPSSSGEIPNSSAPTLSSNNTLLSSSALSASSSVAVSSAVSFSSSAAGSSTVSSTETTPVIKPPVTFSFLGTLTGNIDSTKMITILITGESLDSAITVSTAFDTELAEYSGHASLDTSAGTTFLAQVLVYDTQSRLTGFKEKLFSTLSYSVHIAGFSSINSLPWATIDPIANASINDAITVTSQMGDSLRGGSISKVEWRDGNGSYTVQSDSTYTLTLPDTANPAYPLYVRVTDSDDNTYVDSLTMNILQDAPIISVSAGDSTLGVSDDINIHWQATDQYGSVVTYFFKPSHENNWQNIGTDTSITIASTGVIGTYHYLIMAEDDDGNSSIDSVEVQVMNTPPILRSHEFSISENKLAGSDLVTLVADDQDGDAQTFSIVGGNAQAYFTLSQTGGLSTNALLDYETLPICSLQVEVADKVASTTGWVIIPLIDENEPFVLNGDPVFNPLAWQEDIVLPLNFSVTDADATPVVWSIEAGHGPSLGTITGLGAADSIQLVYTPTLNASGPELFTLTITDGVQVQELEISILLNPVDDPTIFTTKPSLNRNGTVAPGDQLTVDIGVCEDADNTVTTHVEWMREGFVKVGSGTSYTVTDDDAGMPLAARVTCTGERDVYGWSSFVNVDFLVSP
ncbi:MAG: cadherin repeat domain-containing protein [Fibrobacterales bacterium]